LLKDPKPFKDNRFLQLLVAWMLLVWVLSAIAPFSRPEWVIENFLVIAYATVLTLTYRQFRFTNLSYGLFALFWTLHLIGAHYTYAETPVGFWLQDLLGSTRNNYDRLVHFSYGLLCVYAMWDILIRAARVRRSWSYFLAVTAILAFSSFYELLEAIVAGVLTPELGRMWIGAQGDVWDAHKDTLLAFLGAIIAMLITWGFVRLETRRHS
jgi:putative membrane protein